MFNAAIYYISGPFLLRIRDGSISVFFCKIDTVSKKINLVSVYIVDTADNVGLYNSLNEFHTANFRRSFLPRDAL